MLHTYNSNHSSSSSSLFSSQLRGLYLAPLIQAMQKKMADRKVTEEDLEEYLKDELKQIDTITQSVLGSQTPDRMFEDRIVCINLLCGMITDKQFGAFSRAIRMSLVNALHHCLDEYLNFQYFKISQNASLDVIHRISENDRKEYMQGLEKKLKPLYKDNTVSTDMMYGIHCILSAFKAIQTEEGFWGQVIENARASSSGSTVSLLLNVAVKALTSNPGDWYFHVWAMRNQVRQLIAEPNEYLFYQLIAYLRFSLEVSVSKWESDWAIGYTVGEALIMIIQHCPVEHLKSLAFENTPDRRHKIPAYAEKTGEGVKIELLDDDTRFLEEAHQFTQDCKDSREIKEDKEAVSALNAQNSTATLSSSSSSSNSKDTKEVKEKQDNASPFYIDIRYFIATAQQKQNERFSPFCEDRSLYSIVRGLINFVAQANPTSAFYAMAERYLNQLFSHVSAETSLWRKAINLIKCADNPFLEKLLALARQNKASASQTRSSNALTYVLPPSAPHDWDDFVADAVQLKENGTYSQLFNLAMQYYESKKLERFVQEAERLTKLFSATASLTESEIVAFYQAIHRLARVRLASGQTALVDELYTTFKPNDVLAHSTNFYLYAGDTYFWQAVATTQGYFAPAPCYEKALDYYLKARRLEKTASEGLEKRLAYLQLHVMHEHLLSNLGQEMQYYQARPHQEVPFLKILRRIRPWVTRLLNCNLQKEAEAVYALIFPALQARIECWSKKTSFSGDEKAFIQSTAQQLWFHQQYERAGQVYGIDPVSYADKYLACLRHEPCPESKEWKTEVQEPKLPSLKSAKDLQQWVAVLSQDIVAQLGNPWGYRFDLLMGLAWDQVLYVPSVPLQLGVLIAQPIGRYSNYFRELLALLKMQLQLSLDTIVTVPFRYPENLDVIATPAQLSTYDQHIVSDDTRCQLLRPTVAYSNSENQLTIEYKQHLAAQSTQNHALGISWLQQRLDLKQVPLVLLDHFLTGLAWYYGIPQLNLFKILESLQEKTYRIEANFIQQLEQEAKALYADPAAVTYLIPALPVVAKVWQAPLSQYTFHPLREAWKKYHQNIDSSTLAIAIAHDLIKNQRCLDIETHLTYFQQVPTSFKPLYYSELKKAIETIPAELKDTKAISNNILTVLGEQPDAFGSRVITQERQQAFEKQVLEIGLTEEKSTASSAQLQVETGRSQEQKATPEVFLEWMNNHQKIRRRVKSSVVAQLLDENHQPQVCHKTPEGKRIVIPVKENNHCLAYVKFWPERPGVQFQVDALTHRIVGYALHWKLCRLVINQNRKEIVYPLLISEPAGDSLFDVCNKRVSTLRFGEVSEHLDLRTYSLLMLLRMVIDPEDDQLANFTVQATLSYQLEPAYRFTCIDGDHAFDEAFITENHQTYVNVKSFLFCMDQMLKPLDQRAVKEYLALNIYGLLREWLSEVNQFEQSHIARQNAGLFSLDEVENFLNAKKLQESKGEVVVDSTCIPTMFKHHLVKGLFQRLVAIQEILKTNSRITLFDLLVKVNKDLAEYYRKPLQSIASPWDRFSTLPHNYKLDKLLVKTDKIIPVSSTRPNSAFLGQIYSTILPNSRKKLSNQEMFAEFKKPNYAAERQATIDQELSEIYLLYASTEKADELFRDNLGWMKTLDGLALEILLNRTKWQVVASDTARRVLKTAAATNASYSMLKLADCKELNDGSLSALLQASGSTLLELNLSRCPKLTSTAIDYLKHCTQLRRLKLSETSLGMLIGDRSFRGKLYPAAFPEMEECIAENCPSLTEVHLNAPRLRSLRLNGASKLTNINLSGTPSLHLLELKGCDQVPHRAFLEKYPFLAGCHFSFVTEAAIKQLDEQLTEIFQRLPFGFTWARYPDEVLRMAAAMVADYISATEPILETFLSGDMNERSLEAFSALGRYDESLLQLLMKRAKKEGYARRDKSAAIVLLQLIQGKPDALLQVTRALLSALQNKDNYWVRVNAVWMLGAIGSIPSEVVHQVIQALLSALQNNKARMFNEEILVNAAWALGKIDLIPSGVVPQVIQALLSALRDRYSNVQTTAAEALGEISPIPSEVLPQVVKALLSALWDRCSNVRTTAAETLIKISQASSEVLPQVIQALLSALQNGYGDIRTIAAEALGKISPIPSEVLPQVVKALLSALQDRLSGIQHEATKALIKIGQGQAQSEVLPQVIQALLSALQGNDNSVRRKAARALGEIGLIPTEALSQVMQALLGALQDNDYYVWHEAAKVLIKIGQAQSEVSPQVIQALLSALRDIDGDARTTAALGLSEIGPIPSEALPQVIKALLSALQDKCGWGGGRFKAAKALIKIVKTSSEILPQVIRDLLSALHDNDEGVRANAAWALGEIGLIPPEALSQVTQALLSALQDKDAYSVRVKAVGALIRIAKISSEMLPHVIQALLSALQGKDRDLAPYINEKHKCWIRAEAAKALGEIGPIPSKTLPQVIKTLLSALQVQDNYWGLFKAAAALSYEARVMLIKIAKTSSEALVQVIEALLNDLKVRWEGKMSKGFDLTIATLKKIIEENPSALAIMQSLFSQANNKVQKRQLAYAIAMTTPSRIIAFGSALFEKLDALLSSVFLSKTEAVAYQKEISQMHLFGNSDKTEPLLLLTMSYLTEPSQMIPALTLHQSVMTSSKIVALSTSMSSSSCSSSSHSSNSKLLDPLWDWTTPSTQTSLVSASLSTFFSSSSSAASTTTLSSSSSSSFSSSSSSSVQP